jgi:hypothetical protein
MAATDFTATEVTVKSRVTIGNRVLVTALVMGDGTMTTVAASLIGLSRIDVAWTQDVDDAADLGLSTYAGSTVVMDAAITDDQYQLLFCIGY